MIMQKTQCKFLISKKSEGFSYIEVIVSLLIISFIAGLLYFSYSICIKSLYSSKESIRNSIDHLEADEYLRESIQSVLVPFWQKSIDYSFTENEISISWDNGEVTKSFKMKAKAKIIEVNPIYSEEVRIKGLHIKYNVNNKSYETKALFASRYYGDVQI
ncbi:MAG: type II secretion system GspH family protein [Spirochaetia bacterium]|nr:type II secretion system GspH family protein [Spirochaetia bacterium]